MTIFSGRTRSKVILFVLVAAAAIALLGTKLFVGSTGVGATSKERSSSGFAGKSRSGERSQAQFVNLSERQAGTLKIGATEPRDFEIFKTAVGTIDFNQYMLVQVFSQYPGKILKAFFNVGDDV